ncbi:voltage-gated sodium channel [Crossiella equi]|uniref:Voltage-gated sodium channel n=1 Tax=Crossiella equi TaxID=130796 RepID=A0ABS5AP94_9PSEU|nr:ion transporter [Crossiella equi]MBP2478067.1 voltage-gated sodium channel [Crossiella equi]
MDSGEGDRGLRGQVRRLVDAERFQQAIVLVIVVNAVVLGLETSDAVQREYGGVLNTVDALSLAVFVVEIALRLYAYRLEFFRDPWNCFDLLVVGVSLAPFAHGSAALRALRVVRVLRLLSSLPNLRRVVAALLSAVPAVLSIVAVLSLLLYVAGVMATNLYHDAPGGYFTDIGASMLTLFQIITGDAWSDVMREVMTIDPWAWTFFVAFVLLGTFTVLNLFIATMVTAMESQIAAEQQAAREAIARQDVDEAAARRDTTLPVPREGESVETAILLELRALRAEVRELRAAHD